MFWVTVESKGFSADWIDNLIVDAGSSEEAIGLGKQYILDTFPCREIVTEAEAYRIRNDRSRVIGRLAGWQTTTT